MVETINWAVNVDVASGPKLSASGTTEVDAYDKFAIALEAGATGVDVDLLPTGDGPIRLLMIKSNVYDETITYSTDDGTTNIELDAPVTLIGAGAVGLLAANITALQLANGTEQVALVEIFIGRDAT